jgi:O-antigen ligase
VTESVAASPPRLGPGPLAARAAIIILALLALPLLYAQPLWLMTAILGGTALAAMFVDRTLVIPVVVLALPLEISKDYLPSIYDDPRTLTVQESILDAGRLTMLVAGALWVARARSSWASGLPKSGLYLPLILMAGLFVASSAYSEDASGALRQVFRLGSGLALFALVVLYVRDRPSLDRAVIALIASGLILGLLGLYQQATDSYWFNEGLARLDIPRRNATFFDPNIYARFLIVVAAMALALSSAAKSWRLLFLLAAGGAVLLALPFTSSRSNWAAAALVLPLVVAILPATGWRKVHILAAGAGAAAVFALVASAVEPSLVDRFRSITSGDESLGSRSYLIRAGWQMFLDHPLFGVGLNGYRDALEDAYSSFLPQNATIFLSHSTVITIMAELGLLGLAVLALLVFRFAEAGWRVYRRSGPEDRALVAGLAGAGLAVLVSSQSEARLIEDPYLWLVLGLMAALWGIRRKELQRPDAAAEPSP